MVSIEFIYFFFEILLLTFCLYRNFTNVFQIFVFTFHAGYLNEGGKLNLKRFEIFMEEMGNIDRDLFRENYEKLQYNDTKQGNEETFGVELTTETKNDLDELIKKTVRIFFY